MKLWRTQRNLTQDELAGRAGISKPYLSQIETGKRQGTVDTLRAIARALDVPPDVLIGWEERESVPGFPIDNLNQYEVCP